MTDSPVAGRTTGAAARSPFAGRSCCYCAWRVERDASGETRDRQAFETVETGTTAASFRVGDRRVTPAGRPLPDVDETCVAASEWADDWWGRIDADRTTDGSARRAVERRVAAGEHVTALPGVIYRGDATAVRRALAVSVVSRVVFGGVVALAGVAAVVVTAHFPV